MCALAFYHWRQVFISLLAFIGNLMCGKYLLQHATVPGTFKNTVELYSFVTIVVILDKTTF